MYKATTEFQIICVLENSFLCCRLPGAVVSFQSSLYDPPQEICEIKTIKLSTTTVVVKQTHGKLNLKK